MAKENIWTIFCHFPDLLRYCDRPLKFLVVAFVNKGSNYHRELYGDSYVSYSALMICALNSANLKNSCKFYLYF